MTSAMPKKAILTPLLLLLLLILSSCGGGGGSSSSSDSIDIGVGPGSSSNATLAVAKSALQLSESTTISATFKDSTGTPVSGIPVTFTTTLGTLTQPGTSLALPANGVLTNSDGMATVALTAGSSSGQGQITASATVDNKFVTKTTLFSVNLPKLTLKNIVLTGNTTGAIDFGSTQNISVDVMDENNELFKLQSVDVIFSSTQAQAGKATISSPRPSVDGKVSATYTAVSATGADTITASIAGSSVTIPITVNALNAGSISYVSASPLSIGLKGMGGLGIQETSRVTFRVVDTSGSPKSNQPVTFAFNTVGGGSTGLGGLLLLPSSGSTGSDGTVSTMVQAGTIATPIRVVASTTVNGVTLSTQSDQLVASTGIPAQDSYSVSFSNLNSQSFRHDGVQVDVTARLSDHFHNPVPDGTAVYFTTTGGSITPSCTTSGGGCTVKWTSQEPRPDNGRVVILSYAVGEEAFVDWNGSGFADFGEFTPDTVAFRDDKFACTGLLTAAAVKQCVVNDGQLPWLDFNSNTWAVGASHVFPDPDPRYIGVLQGVDQNGTPYAAMTNPPPRLKHIFKNSQIVMSTDDARISFKPVTTPVVPDSTAVTEIAPTTTSTTITGPGRFQVLVSDKNGNTMASGTTIAVSAPFGALTGDTSITVPQNTGAGQTLTLSIAASDSPTNRSPGLVTVKVTSPSGLITTGYIPISGSF